MSRSDEIELAAVYAKKGVQDAQEKLDLWSKNILNRAIALDIGSLTVKVGGRVSKIQMSWRNESVGGSGEGPMSSKFKPITTSTTQIPPSNQEQRSHFEQSNPSHVHPENKAAVDEMSFSSDGRDARISVSPFRSEVKVLGGGSGQGQCGTLDENSAPVRFSVQRGGTGSGQGS